MEEILNSPEKIKEEVFASWLTVVHGRHFSNPEAMPEGAHNAYLMYRDCINNGRAKDDPEVIKYDRKFKELTGYEASDFNKFQDNFNENEIPLTLSTDKHPLSSRKEQK